MTISFPILNRWTGNIQFTAEIECDENAPTRLKMGLAVKWALLSDAVLRGADLSGAVLRGADLSDADLRGAVLRDAVLRGADLRGANLRDAVLRGAALRGADLRDADLRGADLSGADLRGAVLRGADLRDADLRGADLSGVPKIENIHQAVFNAASAPDALDMEIWHNSCGTAHCRAGWVVTLAGDAGKAMEFCIGTSAAAALIYFASDPKIERVPNFFATNEDALADMKRLAGLEAAKAA